MKEEKNQVREHWGGSLGFVLAAAGSAIGLGNLWKFPYVTGQNGGGAFILVYLLAVLVIGFPVMVCEISIGRNAQADPISAFQKLCPKKTGSTHMAGVLLLLAACGLFCFGKFGLAGLFFLVALVIFWYGWAAVSRSTEPSAAGRSPTSLKGSFSSSTLPTPSRPSRFSTPLSKLPPTGFSFSFSFR